MEQHERLPLVCPEREMSDRRKRGVYFSWLAILVLPNSSVRLPITATWSQATVRLVHKTLQSQSAISLQFLATSTCYRGFYVTLSLGLSTQKRPPPPSRAVEEIPEQQHVPPSKYQPFFNFQEAPKQSFKSSMAQSLTWGFGMTLAFIAVASVFS